MIYRVAIDIAAQRVRSETENMTQRVLNILGPREQHVEDHGRCCERERACPAQAEPMRSVEEVRTAVGGDIYHR